MSGKVLVVFADGDAVDKVGDVINRIIERMSCGNGAPALGSVPTDPPGVAERRPLFDDRNAEDDGEPETGGDDADETGDEDSRAVQPIAAVRSLPVKNGRITEVDVLRALANAGAPLKARLIGEALGCKNRSTVSNALQQLRRGGFADVMGEKSKAVWQPTTKGIKRLAELVKEGGGGNWSAESRKLYAYLTRQERTCAIEEVLDDLQWSRALFERAVNREEFTVKGANVELTP